MKLGILAFLVKIFYLASFFAWGGGEVCKPPVGTDTGKTTFCFFSLNNPQEQTHFADKYKGIENVQVKEFYGKDQKSQPVKERFKAMLKETECDCLVISGHHVGYFTGKQSIGGNKDWSLDLDFMEDLSCEEGCEGWFSNVKCLFLMGCQTVEPQKMKTDGHSADSETIRVTSPMRVQVARSVQVHDKINQAFSSTLDQNDSLSHRYLRMFPESSLYGWGGTSPGKKAGSHHSLPNFIALVQHWKADDSRETLRDNQATHVDTQPAAILNFIALMNQSDTCHQYSDLTGQWALHWRDKGARASSCFLHPGTDIKQDFKKYQKQGCALTKALKGGKPQEIQRAVDSILASGAEGIKANFNRLMSLVTNRDNHDKSWYKGVIAKLKGSELLKGAVVEGIQSSKAGFVRKSDYLYFYKEMGWIGEDTERDSELSQGFLQQLNTAFDNIGQTQRIIKEGKTHQVNIPEVVQFAHRKLVFDSIAQNDLGKFLSKEAPNSFNTLRNQFMQSGDVFDQVHGHFLTYLRENPQSGDITSADNFFKTDKGHLKEKGKNHYENFKGWACYYKTDKYKRPCPF